jgi:RNase P/RNase MRP subunit p29
MRTLTLMVILIIFSTFNPFSCIAQEIVEETQKLFKIETKDGNEFIGTIVSEDENSIVLKTQLLGEITIKREVIVSIREVDRSKIVEGVLWDDNPQSSRYLWTPNGYGLKKGEGYYQNIWVLYNQVSFGLSDYFSLSGGTIPIFLLSFGESSPIWIVPKLSIPIKREKVNISAGAFMGTVLGETETGFGIVFSTLTLGDRNLNANFGIGWGYAMGEWAENPIFNLSGIVRLTSKGYLMTENYYILDAVIISAGYRYMVKKVGLDFGIYLFLEEAFALPIVGVTIPFENKKR